jgi:hypothetical protein
MAFLGSGRFFRRDFFMICLPSPIVLCCLILAEIGDFAKAFLVEACGVGRTERVLPLLFLPRPS